MKNNYLFYILNSVFLILFTLILVFADNHFLGLVLTSIGILLAIIWDFHYFTIKYEVSDNMLTIKSGIIFKRMKKIPLEKVILKSVYSVGKNIFLTVIRTSGSFAVIFGYL